MVFNATFNNISVISWRVMTFKLFGFQIFWLWAYLMKVFSRNASCALNMISTFLFFF